MSESVLTDEPGVSSFVARSGNGTSGRVRDIVWRTNFELALEEARKLRRAIVVKPLNQGGSGEFW